MITPNPLFGQPRRRPENALPQIGPLAFDGGRTREDPAQGGASQATVIRSPNRCGGTVPPRPWPSPCKSSTN